MAPFQNCMLTKFSVPSIKLHKMANWCLVNALPLGACLHVGVDVKNFHALFCIITPQTKQAQLRMLTSTRSPQTLTLHSHVALNTPSLTSARYSKVRITEDIREALRRDEHFHKFTTILIGKTLKIRSSASCSAWPWLFVFFPKKSDTKY